MDKLRQRIKENRNKHAEMKRVCFYKKKKEGELVKKNEQINNIIYELADHQRKEIIHGLTSGACQILHLEKPILNI